MHFNKKTSKLKASYLPDSWERFLYKCSHDKLVDKYRYDSCKKRYLNNSVTNWTGDNKYILFL